MPLPCWRAAATRTTDVRVPVGLKVGAFAIFVMGGYSWFANSIPQIESKPPQELSLQGGMVDVTLADIPATAGAPAGGGAVPAEVKIPGDPKGGEQVFQGKGTCIACHKAGKIGASPVGPDLSQIAKIQTPDYIMHKILDPKGMGTVAGFPPGVMPQDLGTRLAAKEYVDLVAFLLTLK